MAVRIDLQKGISQTYTGASYAFTGTKAQNMVTVVNWVNLSGETLTVNGTALIQDTHWTASTSNDATADSIEAAINANVAGVTATYVTSERAAVIHLEVDAAGTAGNAYTLATTDSNYLTIEGATFYNGYDAISADVIGGTNCYQFGEQQVISDTSTNSMILATEPNHLLDADGCVIIGGSGNQILDEHSDYSSIIMSVNSVIRNESYGSLILMGEDHVIDNDDYGVIIGGDDCSINGNGTQNTIINSYFSRISGSNWLATIVGSEYSGITSGSNYCGIYSAGDGQISGRCGYAVIIGGYHQQINDYDYYSAIIGGDSNEINAGSGYCSILACNGVTLSDYLGGSGSLEGDGAYVTGAVSCEGGVSEGYYSVALASSNHAVSLNYSVLRANSRTLTKNQVCDRVCNIYTTSATPTGPSNIARFLPRLLYNGTLATNTSYYFTLEMVSQQSAGTAGTVGDTCSKKYEFLVKYVGGTSSLVGVITETVIGYDAAASDWGLTITIDDINDELDFVFTGEADKTIETTVNIHMVEVGK